MTNETANETTSETNGNMSDESPARDALGAALRRLHHAVVGHHASEEPLLEMAAQINGWSASLETGDSRSRPAMSFGYEDTPDPLEGEVLSPGHAARPYSGSASPFGLDMVVRREGDTVVTEFVLGSAHEGAPERSHGGIVAAMFDDLTGFVLQLAKRTAFTGELSVRYEAGVPLHVPLRARAWLTKHEGRRLYMEAELHHGDQRVARCDALFIARAAAS